MVSERARRELGTWPSADVMLEQVIRALREAERSEARPEEKGKLRATIDYLVGAGRDIAVGGPGVPSRRPAQLKGQLRENPSQARALRRIPEVRPLTALARSASPSAGGTRHS